MLLKCSILLLIMLAFIKFSGIITTILGKTATNTKGAGRERRVHHSKSLPLPFNGERLFFRLQFLIDMAIKIHIIQKLMYILPDLVAPGGLFRGNEYPSGNLSIRPALQTFIT